MIKIKLILILTLLSSAFAQQYENSSYYKAEQMFIQKNYSEALRIIKTIPPENAYYQNALLLG